MTVRFGLPVLGVLALAAALSSCDEAPLIPAPAPPMSAGNDQGMPPPPPPQSGWNNSPPPQQNGWPMRPAGGHAIPDEFNGVCSATGAFTDRFFNNALGPGWKVDTRPAGPNPNHELEAYTANVFRVGGGSVRVFAARDANGNIASTRINTTRSFHFGCFEVVARMPVGKGLWPAIWLRTDLAKPNNGEIDIMEGFGSHPGVIQSTIHGWANGRHLGATCIRIGAQGQEAFGKTHTCAWQPLDPQTDFSNGMHRYGMIWTPTEVTWFLDGHRYFTTRDFIPNQDMYIHLNLAVGGVFDGAPDTSTPFPAAMEVRSVRAWPLAN